MPVSVWMPGSMLISGLTSVDHSGASSKPFTSNTAISVTRSCAGCVPVVSRSTIASGASLRPMSLWPDVRRPDDLRPPGGIGADPLDELLRRAAYRLGADRGEPLQHVVGFQRGNRFGLQPRDDLVRRAGGGEQAAPGGAVGNRQHPPRRGRPVQPKPPY